MVSDARQRDLSPAQDSPTQIHRQFRELLDKGCPLRIAGHAARDPAQLLRRYTPKHRIDFFGHHFYLTNVRHDNQFRFFVAYVQLFSDNRPAYLRPLYPRIFYKDSSLIWRVATHYIKSDKDHWIGKGDVKPVLEDGLTVWYSAEETTNLPYEIQNALDTVSRRVNRTQADRKALRLFLRNAPDNRVHPYADFSAPRERAMSDPARSIYNNQPVAWFEQSDDPASLKFAFGFEPDFKNGLIGTSHSRSKLYGGDVIRFRIASKNRQIQYLFIKASQQSWIIPPQTMSHEILSYGVRLVDAHVDDKLCIPGYEYHFLDDPDDPDSLYSQIPPGFAGPHSKIDPQRADVSPWNHQMPVIKSFHRNLQKLQNKARV